jgi:hypothetical protein
MKPENAITTETPDPKGWTPEHVREHLQNAVYLELWTVPLYLTAAYSIVVPIDPKTNRPEIVNLDNLPKNPDGSFNFDAFTPAQCNQYAFDSVLSVGIQEMLHLELAANIANAVRPAQTITPSNIWVRFTDNWAPVYTAAPPCLNAPLPDGVVLELGPLNENQIRLFEWIEEERAPTGDPQAYSPSYNSIGNFYTALAYGLQVCWPALYPPHGCSIDPPPTPADLYQKQDWGEAVVKSMQRGGRLPSLLSRELVRLQGLSVSKASTPTTTVNTAPAELGTVDDYPFSIQVYGSPEDAQAFAQTAMIAISVQGEGAGPGEEVPPQFQPTTGDPIELFLDTQSHWERFTQLRQQLVEKNRIQCIQATPSADLQQFQMALYQSYSSFLVSLDNIFSTAATLGFEAMAGLGNRTLQVWQQGGTPEYIWQNPQSYQKPGFHACQGLDEAGASQCATAFFHTCSGTNTCVGQGGCGYQGDPNDPSDNWVPNFNACLNKGGCGAPIPYCQIFSSSAPELDSKGRKVRGECVWTYARQLMRDKFPAFPATDPGPDQFRKGLTPTSGPTPPPDQDTPC